METPASRPFYRISDSPPIYVVNEDQIVRIAVDLGAHDFGGPLSAEEERVVAGSRERAAALLQNDLDSIRASIQSGEDPLGEAISSLRSSGAKRLIGAVYTPKALVKPMVSWVLQHQPARVVDAGAGSGRFALEIARHHPTAEIVAVDLDPVASIITRAGFAALDQKSARVLNIDYIKFNLDASPDLTAFIGNPPYIRHHNLSPSTKAWAQMAARSLGLKVSGLAGLHAYFFLATALIAKKGDIGCFVTSSEWLDVNYGSIIRELLLTKLGGKSLHVVKPTSQPFAETATTAAISCFEAGTQADSIRLEQVESIAHLGELDDGKPIARERLVEASRWTPIIRTRRGIRSDQIELGEICSVHRGAVTGSNAVWITEASNSSLPQRLLFPSVTRARELFRAGFVLDRDDALRRVIDLPQDLDSLEAAEKHQVETFLEAARKAGAADGYIARYRKAWWSIGLRSPAPILASYMARRPPAFVRNLVGARHINIAHGLYPKVPLSDAALDRLTLALRTSISVAQGRTYAGGLTKFEPREMERLPIPDLPVLLGQS